MVVILFVNFDVGLRIYRLPSAYPSVRHAVADMDSPDYESVLFELDKRVIQLRCGELDVHNGGKECGWTKRHGGCGVRHPERFIWHVSSGITIIRHVRPWCWSRETFKQLW